MKFSFVMAGILLMASARAEACVGAQGDGATYRCVGTGERTLQYYISGYGQRNRASHYTCYKVQSFQGQIEGPTVAPHSFLAVGSVGVLHRIGGGLVLAFSGTRGAVYCTTDSGMLR